MADAEDKKIGGPPDLDRVYVEFEFLRQQVEKLIEVVGKQADALDTVSEFIVKQDKMG